FDATTPSASRAARRPVSLLCSATGCACGRHVPRLLREDAVVVLRDPHVATVLTHLDAHNSLSVLDPAPDYMRHMEPFAGRGSSQASNNASAPAVPRCCSSSMY